MISIKRLMDFLDRCCAGHAYVEIDAFDLRLLADSVLFAATVNPMKYRVYVRTRESLEMDFEGDRLTIDSHGNLLITEGSRTVALFREGVWDYVEDFTSVVGCARLVRGETEARIDPNRRTRSKLNSQFL